MRSAQSRISPAALRTAFSRSPGNCSIKSRIQSQTFISALRSSGLTEPWLIDGAMDRVAFDLYVETQLAPTLQRGEVVILDNLTRIMRLM